MSSRAVVKNVGGWILIAIISATFLKIVEGNEKTYYVKKEGVIFSPNYPEPYPSNFSGTWHFAFPEGYRIKIVFVDEFEVEGGPDCIHDYILLYDGPSFNEPLLGKYCSSHPPTDKILSSKNQMVMQFLTDGWRELDGYRGFKAKVIAVRSETYYVKEDGVIYSPNYPLLYPSNFIGTWHFVFPEGYRIRIVFDSFRLEPSPNCTHDYIILYDGSFNDPLLGKYCRDTVPEILLSSKNQMVMQFHTDERVEYPGFKATVKAGHFQQYSAKRDDIISSPNYPNPYLNDMDITRLFTVPEDYKVVLVFEKDFHPEGGWNCSNDYITFHDGLSSNAPFIQKYCGNVIPYVVKSSGNHMYMVFHKDSSSAGKGFEVKVTSEFIMNTVISNETQINLTSQYLQSRRKQGRPINKWGTDLTRLAAVLSLTRSPDTDGCNFVFEEMVYELTLQLTSRLVTKTYIYTNELALYINAMRAVCIDPKKFYGLDIVSELRKRVDNRIRIPPFFLLSLCIGGDNMTREDVRKLQQQFNEKSQPSSIETQAMVILALKCISQRIKINLHNTLEDMISEITKNQQSNGKIENVKSTALLIQALIATESYRTYFNMTNALKYILKDMKQCDTEEMFYVLPVFYWKSLLDIDSFNCGNFIKTEVEDVKNLENGFLDEQIQIQISVYDGNDMDLIRTWRVKVPSYYSLYQTMENNISSLNPEYKIRYRIVEGKPYIEALGSQQNNDIVDLFWYTYTKPLLSNSKMVLTEESHIDIKVKETDEIILWYRSKYWPLIEILPSVLGLLSN